MKKLLITAAAALVLPSAAYAQCAGCDADYNKKERKEAEKEAKERPLKEVLGSGTGRDAHDAQKADQKNIEKQTDEALKDETAPAPK